MLGKSSSGEVQSAMREQENATTTNSKSAETDRNPLAPFAPIRQKTSRATDWLSYNSIGAVLSVSRNLGNLRKVCPKELKV